MGSQIISWISNKAQGLSKIDPKQQSKLPEQLLLGQAQITVTGNVATGNLYLQDHRKTWADLGGPVELGWAYNSQGTPTWRWSWSESVGSVTGTVNEPGSTVAWVAADGAESVYSYDASTKQYTYMHPVEGLCQITALTGDTWQRTVVNTGVTETYDDKGRLTEWRDKAGHTREYTYSDSGDITLTLASKEVITLHKTDSGMTLHMGDATTAPIATYAINENGQLTQTTIAVDKSTSYAINYAYDSTMGLLKSIDQSDQSQVQFDFDDSKRLSTLTDGEQRQLEVAYTSDSVTTIKNGIGQEIKYGINADKQLTALTTNSLGQAISQGWAFNTVGQLESYTQTDGTKQTWSHNSTGLLASNTAAQGEQKEDIIYSDGPIVGLIWNTTNVLVDTATGQTRNLTTRTVWNEKRQRRYTISPKGAVTRFDYDQNGCLVSERQLLQTAYDVSQLNPTDCRTEAEMDEWYAGLKVTDLQASTLKTYARNVRGQCSSATVFATLDVKTAEGVLDDKAKQVSFDWDGFDHCLTATDLVQTDSQGQAIITAKAVDSYDGLDRHKSHTDALNQQTTWSYDDANSAITEQQLASGMTIKLIQDKSGRTVKRDENGTDKTSGRALPALHTIYERDAAGRTFKTTHADNAIEYSLHDALGREVYYIDRISRLTKKSYSDTGQVTDQYEYAADIDSSSINADPGRVEPTEAADKDARTTTRYDMRGRVEMTINAESEVNTVERDTAGRIIKTTSFATRLTTADRSQPPAKADDDREIFSKVDDDDHPIYKQVMEDDYGYVTQFDRDLSGTIKHQCCYAKPVKAEAYAELDTKDDENGHDYFYHDQRLQQTGHVDAENYLTTDERRADGKVVTHRRYETAVTKAPATTALVDIKPAEVANDEWLQSVYDALGRNTQTTTSNQTCVDREYNSYNTEISTKTTDIKPVERNDENPNPSRETKTYCNSQNQITAELNPRVCALIQAIEADRTITPETKKAKIQAVIQSKAIQHIYDYLSGLRTQTLQPNDDESALVKTVFYYDADKRMVLSIDPEGGVTRFGYDHASNPNLTRKLTAKLPKDQIASLVGGFITDTLNQQIDALEKDNDTLLTKIFNRVHRKIKEVRGKDRFTKMIARNAFGQAETTTETVTGNQTKTVKNEYTKRGLLHKLSKVSQDGAASFITDVWTYDAHAKPNTHLDVFDNLTQFKNDCLGRLKTTVDYVGRSISKTWDAFSRMLSVTDKNGHMENTVYNQMKRSQTTTLADKKSTHQLVHNAFQQTIEETVADASAAKGGVITTKTSKSYEVGGEVESETDALGNVTSFTCNINGWQKTRTEDGVLMRSDHDDAGHVVVEVTDPEGVDRKVYHSYDGRGLDSSTTDAEGNVTQTTYDDCEDISELVEDVKPAQADGKVHANRITQMSYTGQGNKLQETLGDDKTLDQFTLAEEFDAFGQHSASIVDPNGATGEPALNLKTQTIRDAADRVAMHIDPNNQVTYFVYDEVTSKKRYEISSKNAVIEWCYDPAGNEIKQWHYANTVDMSAFSASNLPRVGDIQGVLGKISTDGWGEYKAYDERDTLKFTLRSDGKLTEYFHNYYRKQTQKTEYASRVDVPSMKGFTLADMQAVAVKDDDKDRTTIKIYDAAQREIYQIDADGFVTETERDSAGNIIMQREYFTPVKIEQLTDYKPETIAAALSKSARDRLTQYLHNSLNELAYEIEYLDDSQFYVTAYTNDKNGRLGQTIEYLTKFPVLTYMDIDSIKKLCTTVTDLSAMRKTVYENDGLGRQVKETVYVVDEKKPSQYRPVTESWTHNVFDEQTSHTNRNHHVWQWHYDRAKRKSLSITPEIQIQRPVWDKDAGKFHVSDTVTAPIQTKFDWDKCSNLQAKTYAYGQEEAHKETFMRDVNGLPIAELEDNTINDATKQPTEEGESLSTKTTVIRHFVYDAHNRKIMTYLTLHNLSDKDAFQHEFYIYDENGKDIRYVVNGEGEINETKHSTFDQPEATLSYETRMPITDAMKVNGIAKSEIEAFVAQHTSARQIDIAYNPRGLKTEVKQPEKLIVHTEAGVEDAAMGRPITDFCYTHLGQLCEQSETLNASGTKKRTEKTRFDRSGEEVVSVKASGHAIFLGKDRDGHEIGRLESAEPLPATVNPLNDDLSTIRANQPKNVKDRTTAQVFNLLGYRTSYARKGIGLPTIQEDEAVVIEQDAKDIVTGFVPDDMGNILEVHMPVVPGHDQKAPVEGHVYNAMNQLTKVIHPTRFPREEDGKRSATGITPVTEHHIDPRGRAFATTDISDTSVDGQPAPGALQRSTIKELNEKGHALFKQDAEGNLQQTSMTATEKTARELKFLTVNEQTVNDGKSIDYTKSKKPVMVEKAYDQADREIKSVTTDHTSEVNADKTAAVTTHTKTRNAHGEVTNEGDGTTNHIDRRFDNCGGVWFSNEHGGSPQVMLSNAAANETLTLRSRKDVLTPASYADLPTLLDEKKTDIDQVLKTVTSHDSNGGITQQNLPSSTQPMTVPFATSIKLGPDKDLGATYGISLPLPVEGAMKYSLTIWPKGHPEIKHSFSEAAGNIKRKNHRLWIEGNALSPDQYEGELVQTYVDPGTGEHKVVRSAQVNLPITTPKQGTSYNPVVTVRDDNQLVVTGNLTGIKGVALYHNGELIKKVSLKHDAVSNTMVADLSSFNSQRFDVKLIKTRQSKVGPLNIGEEASSGLKMEYHRTELTPHGKPSYMLDDEITRRWSIPLPTSRYPGWTNAFQRNDTPTFGGTLKAAFTFVTTRWQQEFVHYDTRRKLQGVYELVDSLDAESTALHDFSVASVNRSYFSETGTYGSGFLLSSAAPVDVKLFIEDADEKRWMIGRVYNHLKPEQTTITPKIYVHPAKAPDLMEVDLICKDGHVSATLPLEPWAGGTYYFDASSIGKSGADHRYQFYQLGAPEPDVVATVNLHTTHPGAGLELIPINLRGMQAYNYQMMSFGGGYNGGLKFTYNTDPSLKNNVIKIETTYHYAPTGTEKLDAVVAYGPNSPFKCCPLATSMSEFDFGEYYVGGSPVTAYMQIFDNDWALILQHEIPQPDPKDPYNYLMSDRRLLYLRPLPTSEVETVQFYYAENDFDTDPVWGKITAGKEWVNENGVTINVADVPDGHRRYRFRMLKANGDVVDLSHLGPVDSDGCLCGDYTFNEGANTYVTTQDPLLQRFDPIRKQVNDAWGNATATSDVVNIDTPDAQIPWHRTEFNGKNKEVKAVAPTVEVTDDKGVTKKANPTTIYGFNERDQHFMTQDANGHISQRVLDEADEEIESTTPLGVYVRSIRDGFGRVIKLVKPHPTAPNNRVVFQSFYNLLNAVTRKVDPNGWVQCWTYNEDNKELTHTTEQLGETDLATLRYNRDGGARVITRILPEGQRVETTFNHNSSNAVHIERNIDLISGEKQVTINVLNWFGLIQSTTDIGGGIVHCTYDMLNQMLTKQGDPQHLGKHGTHYIAPGKQEPVAAQDIKNVYNEAGRLIATFDQAQQKRTQNVLNVKGDVVGRWFTAQDGRQYQATNQETNALGWLMKIYDTRYVVHYRYDQKGNRIATEVHYYDDSGQQVLLQSKGFKVDADDNIRIDKGQFTPTKGVTAGNSGSSTYGYSHGYVVSETVVDSQGHSKTTALSYCPNGLLSSIAAPDKSTAFDWYRDGNRKSTVDKNSAGQVTRSESEDINRNAWVLEQVQAHLGQTSTTKNQAFGPKGQVKQSKTLTRVSGGTITDDTATAFDDFDTALVSKRSGKRYCTIKGYKPEVDFTSLYVTYTPNGHIQSVEGSVPDTMLEALFEEEGEEYDYEFVDHLAQEDLSFDDADSVHVGDEESKPVLTHAFIARQQSHRKVMTIAGKVLSSGSVNDTYKFRYFVVDGNGLIVMKRTSVKGGQIEYYYYNTVGDLVGRAGNIKEANGVPVYVDFDLMHQMVTENFPPRCSATYLVTDQNGLSFEEVSQRQYGTKSLATLVANANNHSDPSYIVPYGEEVETPSFIDSIKKDGAFDYLPYNPARIIGSLYPNFPALHLHQIHHHTPWWHEALEIGAMIAISVVAMCLMPESAPFLVMMFESMAVAGLSDVASQEIAIGLGDEHSFNAKELETSVMEGALSGVANAAAPALRTALAGAKGASTMAARVETQMMAQAIESSVNAAMGKEKLSWQGLVAASVSAVSSSAMEEEIPDADGHNISAPEVAERSAWKGMTAAVTAEIQNPERDFADTSAIALGTALGNFVGKEAGQSLKCTTRPSAKERHAIHQQKQQKKVSSGHHDLNLKSWRDSVTLGSPDSVANQTVSKPTSVAKSKSSLFASTKTPKAKQAACESADQQRKRHQQSARSYADHKVAANQAAMQRAAQKASSGQYVINYMNASRTRNFQWFKGLLSGMESEMSRGSEKLELKWKHLTQDDPISFHTAGAFNISYMNQSMRYFSTIPAAQRKYEFWRAAKIPLESVVILSLAPDAEPAFLGASIADLSGGLEFGEVAVDISKNVGIDALFNSQEYWHGIHNFACTIHNAKTPMDYLNLGVQTSYGMAKYALEMAFGESVSDGREAIGRAALGAAFFETEPHHTVPLFEAKNANTLASRFPRLSSQSLFSRPRDLDLISNVERQQIRRGVSDAMYQSSSQRFMDMAMGV